MTPDAPPAAPRRRLPWLWVLAIVPWAVILLLWIWLGLRFSGEDTARFDDPEAHFKYGSIGTETEAGIPYWIWRALPAVFDEETGRIGYFQFGFVFEFDEQGKEHDLPIGIARRERHGVEHVWFNCAACHTGSYRERKEARRVVVPGMPANTFDLQALLRFLFAAAADERFDPDRLIPAMELVGANLDAVDRFAYRHFLIPQARERLLRLRSRLLPLMNRQAGWGQGRADLFNMTLALLLDRSMTTLTPEERTGTADFAALWMQAPRTAMNLHWDGNNNSLDERNLFAALAIGATPESLDRDGLARVKAFLSDLRSPNNPHLDRIELAPLQRGRAVYAAQCAACHGAWDGAYSFEGERLGTIEAIEDVGTDPARFQAFTDSLASSLNGLDLAPHAPPMTHFRKTRGYANLPLDGLWLRGPFLHNGSVPTLWDLLQPPEARPKRFFRGHNVLDFEKGGFLAGPCDPAKTYQFFFCFDTEAPGNSNVGHLYGTALPEADKQALLSYLLAF